MNEFKEVKTAELTGAALDWAVAKAENVGVALIGSHPHIVDEGRLIGGYRPSTSWILGGPLIEKHRIQITPCTVGWFAEVYGAGNQSPVEGDGETSLVAACRAIVAHFLGDTVSVPKELVS